MGVKGKTLYSRWVILARLLVHLNTNPSQPDVIIKYFKSIKGKITLFGVSPVK